jgi:hypothetical protein
LLRPAKRFSSEATARLAYPTTRTAHHSDITDGAPRKRRDKECCVRDLIFTLATIGFFLVAIRYLRGCERLK